MKYYLLLVVVVFTILPVQTVAQTWVTMWDFTANGRTVPIEVSQGDTVEFTCEATGEPRPQIFLTRHSTDEILPVITTNGFRGRNKQTKVTTNITMTCEDTDQYTCFYGRIGGTTIEKFVKVSVRCPLKLISSREITKNISVTTGADLEFDIDVYGYPAPISYSLSQFETGGSLSPIITIPKRKYSVTYKPGDGAKGQVVLNMFGMMESDIGSGRYALYVYNGEGTLYYSFQVIVDSDFQALTECTQIQVENMGSRLSSHSMFVKWTCSISEVDVSPRCLFQLKLADDKGTNYIPVPAGFVNDLPTKMMFNPTRYEKECAVSIPVEALHPENYEFKATMYPSTTSHLDAKSIQSTIKIGISTPNCSEPVISDDKQTVSIACQATGVYKQVMCNFQHSNNMVDYNDTEGVVEPTPPHCSTIFPSCFYHCTLTSKIKDLGEGAYYFRVQMMPILAYDAINLTVSHNAQSVQSGPSSQTHLVLTDKDTDNIGSGSKSSRVKKEDESVSDSTVIGVAVGCGILMLLVGILIGAMIAIRIRRRNNSPGRRAILESTPSVCEDGPPRPPRSPQDPDDPHYNNRNTYAIPDDVKHGQVEAGHYNTVVATEENPYNYYIGSDASLPPYEP